MKHLFTSMSMFFIFLTCSAQAPTTGNIKLIVLNDERLPAENITVQLLKIQDSSLVKVAITDKEGLALFENIKPGNYHLKMSAINFASKYSDAFQVIPGKPEVILPPIQISKKTEQLKEVVVSTKKPFIQKLTDRI